MQWAVNHLAHFLLTHELLSLLQAAPAGRVVTVSSGSHYHARLRWHDIQLKHGYFCLLAYQQTKLCNVLFTAELNRQLREKFHAYGPSQPTPAWSIPRWALKEIPPWRAGSGPSAAAAGYRQSSLPGEWCILPPNLPSKIPRRSIGRMATQKIPIPML